MTINRHELLQSLARWLPEFGKRGQYAAPPLVGYLDRPSVDDGVLRLRGWLCGRGRRVIALSIWGVGSEVDVPLGQARPELAARFTNLPGAATSGFSLDIALTMAPRLVELWATLHGGERMRCFTATIDPITLPPPPNLSAGVPQGRGVDGVAAELSLLAHALAPSVWMGVGLDLGLAESLRRKMPHARGLIVDPSLRLDLPWDPSLVLLCESVERASQRIAIGELGLVIVGPNFASDAQWLLPALHPDGVIASTVVLPSDELAATEAGPLWLHTRAPAGLTLAARAVTSPVTVPPLPTSDTPDVSVVIPVHGRWQLTRRCLAALASVGADTPFEIIVADDASDDDTAARLAEIIGIRTVRHENNRGFGDACNSGAELARGRYVVFLNNDTVPQVGWLDELRRTFDHTARAGLVGAKLVLENGLLQEAGGAFFSDGSARNLGRGQSPDKPEWNHLRDVDYCSGACIMLPTDLFRRLGGFDPIYAPAYYEDGDLAMKVREAGLRVLYQPLSRVVHKEGGTAGTDTNSGAKRYQIINQQKLVDRWQTELRDFPDAGREPRDWGGPRVLIIDHTTPRPDQDSGSLRMANLIQTLVEDGLRVTFAGDDLLSLSPYREALQRIGVEVLYTPFTTSLDAHLTEHGPRYTSVVLSRRDVAARYLPSVRRFAPQARVVFDTVDLHFVREERQHSLGAGERSRSRAIELGLVADTDATLVVSDAERRLLLELGARRPIGVVGNIHRDHITAIAPHAGRNDLLFIGSWAHPPNLDGIVWFLDDIFPAIQRRVPGIRLQIVGKDPPVTLRSRQSTAIRILGHVPDLGPLHQACVAMVAPLRYGAGVKGKITQALCHGLPVIGTTVAVEGMQLTDDVLVSNDEADFVAAVVRLHDDPQLWAKLSQHGLDYATQHLSPSTIRPALYAALGLSALLGQQQP